MSFFVYLLPIYFSIECCILDVPFVRNHFGTCPIGSKILPSPNSICLFLASSFSLSAPQTTDPRGPSLLRNWMVPSSWMASIVSHARFRHHLHNHLRPLSVDRINDRGHPKHPSHRLLDILLERPTPVYPNPLTPTQPLSLNLWRRDGGR